MEEKDNLRIQKFNFLKHPQICTVKYSWRNDPLKKNRITWKRNYQGISKKKLMEIKKAIFQIRFILKV